jgi:hypothetical protein
MLLSNPASDASSRPSRTEHLLSVCLPIAKLASRFIPLLSILTKLVRTLPRHWLESYTVTANSLSARQQSQNAHRRPYYYRIIKDAFYISQSVPQQSLELNPIDPSGSGTLTLVWIWRAAFPTR